MSGTSNLLPTILIVEDEPDVLLILRSLIREITSGYAITTTYSGQEALLHLERHQVPLVITDYNMPGMDGLALTATIKARWPQTHVIMITAYDTLELQRTAREHGVDHFITKPFDLDQLVQALSIGLRPR